eukprot:9483239-Pyramimonas_sp.AAC.1
MGEGEQIAPGFKRHFLDTLVRAIARHLRHCTWPARPIATGSCAITTNAGTAGAAGALGAGRSPHGAETSGRAQIICTARPKKSHESF